MVRCVNEVVVMLKPVIAGFIALHFQDALVFAAVFSGAAFVWDLYAVKTDGIARMNGYDIGWWWIKWAIGVGVAAGVRWWMRRLWGHLRLLGALDAAARQLVVSFLVFLTLTWYQVTVEDPAESLVEPFAAGALLSWLLAWLVLFVLETIDYYVDERPPSEFSPTSLNVVAAVVIAAIILLDLLTFLGNWILALLMIGALALFAGGGWVFKAVGGAPLSKQRMFY